MSITLQRVAHIYNVDSPFSYAALKRIDLEIPEGKVTAIIGETSSGKSTLIQHLNTLLLPSEGEVQILDKAITAGSKSKNLKELHRLASLVFQFPEYQLFEETIEKDISFGPKNFGVSAEETAQRAKEILKVVGLDRSYLQRSPFDLSGGQKRRIIVAGILTMNPDVLVLGESTTGLDPQGTSDMMWLFVDMNKKHGKTVLTVTHDMEHILQYCEEAVVVQDGSIKKHCDVQPFSETVEPLQELNINPPAVIRLREELIRRGPPIDRTLLDMDKLTAVVAYEAKKRG